MGTNITTFTAFNTARLGIYASQTALNVTGNNISNVNTRGYTRQHLDQVSLKTGGRGRYNSIYNINVGQGVLSVGIGQMRDPYLDIRYRDENANVGYNDAKLGGLEELASFLDEVALNDGDGVLEAQLNDFYTQLEVLSRDENVGIEAYDNIVRSSANVLTSLLRKYAQDLKTVKSNQENYLDQEIKNVNTMLDQLAAMNDSIMKAETRGDPALELKDQRNLLLDELSQYVDIKVEYEPVDIGSGLTVDKLKVSIDGTSTLLVDGKYKTQLSQTAGSTNYDLELSGLVSYKDASDVHATQGGVVALGDTTLHGSIQAIREILTEAGEFSTAAAISADPDAASKRGIPYYQNMLDSLARKFAEVFNDANTGYKQNSKGEYLDGTGTVITIPAGTTDVDAYLAGNGGVKMGGNLFSNANDSDDATGITAENITVSKSWTSGDVRIVSTFKTGATGEFDSSQNDNIDQMLILFKGKQDYKATEVVSGAQNTSVFFSGSFQDFLTNMDAVLANDIKSTSALLTTYDTSLTDIASSREAVSSVDLNDETINMMTYQKSYQAACRLMTTVDEMLDKLINNTGTVGR